MNGSVLSLAVMAALILAFHQDATANLALRIANGTLKTPGGEVALGATLEQWKAQWGEPDSFGVGVSVWPKWGIDVNYFRNPCNENRVTALTIYYRAPDNKDLPTTRLPIWLESCAFRYDAPIHGDTLRCGFSNSAKEFILILDHQAKPSEMFFRSRTENAPPQQKKKRIYRSESMHGLISLQVDTLGYLAQLDYGLSNEQAFRIGLERSPMDQKAFADSGNCQALPNLWEP